MSTLAILIAYITVGLVLAIAVGRTLDYAGSENVAFGVAVTFVAWPALLFLLLLAWAVHGVERLLRYNG